MEFRVNAFVSKWKKWMIYDDGLFYIIRFKTLDLYAAFFNNGHFLIHTNTIMLVVCTNKS